MILAGCMVDQYRIKYSGDGGATWTTKTMGQPVNSCLWAAQNTDKLILNLTPSTTYEYQMKAWYCDGSGTSQVVHGVQCKHLLQKMTVLMLVT